MDQLVLRNEEDVLLRQQLGQLPEHYQMILQLRFANGLRCAEIASRLNKSEGAVRMLLSHALKSFAGVDSIAWSPDGQELVYANYVGAPSSKASVTILNVNTGQKVYVYQVSGHAAQTISMDAVWSADSKYIASAESTQSSTFGKQSYVVKVWVA